MNLLERTLLNVPRASVVVDGGIVHLTLSGAAVEGAAVAFPARQLKPFAGATDEQLADVALLEDGALLFWRSLDLEFRVSKLLELVTGVQAAAAIGAKGGAIGGKASTAAKAATAKANGAKGGRPTNEQRTRLAAEKAILAREALRRNSTIVSASDSPKAAALKK